MKKVFLFLSLALLLVNTALGQMITDAVKWDISISDIADGKARISFTAKMKSGWHVYDMNLPEGGPSSTEFLFDTLAGMTLSGEVTPDRKPLDIFDKNFEMNLRWYADEVTFTQELNVEDPENYKVSGEVFFMACNDESCLPPERVEFNFEKGNPVISGAEGEPADMEAASAENGGDTVIGDLWKPVVEELKSFGDTTLSRTTDTSLWRIFIFGFLGGLVALLTPCVWPMIPMTVSFFLKRTKDRKKAIKDAITYGLSIIVIYLLLGLTITSIFGASALNDLSTSAVFNIIFFLLLVVFAVSFFGMFELTLPQSWTNKLDAKADATTGLLSIFFMSFTLVLVSFSCTGPIIGTLLVQAATIGNAVGPAVGMFGFALALSIPFGLFAVFPNMLQSMPKSGGWLNSVKVVLGFLELALALKFLSVADLAYGWGILDREVFVSLWIIIFVLLGMYLLGKITLPHDSEVKRISVPRLLMATVSFAFAMYMVPGLWGAPLKAVSAFAPPLYTQDFNLYEAEVHAEFDDYETGMAYAAKHNKPVMIDFSGYGCVNCRKMEAAVWTDPKVKSVIDNDYVLITLIVDDKTNLPEPMIVTENGKERKLKSIGEKWSYLQRVKFGTNSQPYYVLLDAQGKPLAPSYAYDEDVAKYLDFLESGKREFKERNK